MNIQTDYSYNISMQGKGPIKNKPEINTWNKFKNRVKQRFLNIIPEKTFRSEDSATDKYEKYIGFLSRPHVNRLIMGTTAIATQPWIDLFNKNVDDETRKVSMYRTLSKIVAGTTVGAIVRWSCFKAIGNLTDLNGTKKYSKALLPKTWINKFARHPEYLANYKNTLATTIALGVMVFTNFLLDAPLTVFLTNKFIKNDSALKQKRKEVA